MRPPVLIVLLLAIPLLTRLFFYYDALPNYQNGDDVTISHSLYHEPKSNSYSQYFFVDGIFVSLPLYPRYNYGDSLEITGKITTIITEKDDLLAIKNPEVAVVKNPNPFIGVTKFVRERIEEAIATTIPDREAGLLVGIILGVRDRIDSNFYEDLRTVGVLHVVAASGQNVSILAAIVLVSLQKIVKRRDAVLFTGIMVLFYAMLSGFDPPIVRASIMAIISFGAILLGRQSIGLGALIMTGWGMVMYDPGLLADISFQLSFLATAGIVMIKPFLDRIHQLGKVAFLKDDITTTFSAQLATFPLLLGVFGSYSLISLPVNILILWTVPIVMLLGGVGAILALLNPLFASPLVLLSYPFLLYFTFIVDLFSQISPSISVESLPQALIFGYYLILFGIVILLKNRERRKI